jgi:glycerol kinase
VDATLLALDAGTTGVSAVLFDRELRPVQRAYREFPQRFPRPGWVEHEAEAILAAVDAVLGEALSHPRARAVEALGLTNQRETVFALERGSARALGPGIVWQDRRTEARCRELGDAGHLARVQERTGLVLDPYFSATKIEWMLANDPELRARARAGEVLFATVDTLLLAHLTGGATRATDPTNAARTMLFHLGERRWDPDLCALFGVDAAWLPEVRASAGDFGTTDPARTGRRELPIRGVAGDQQAALFGQGCFDPGSLKVTYGTGSFLLLNTGAERRDSTRGLITTLAVGRDGGAVFALEGSVFVCGALVQWLRDQLGLIARASDIEALALSVPDSGGVFVVPAFTGLGAPHWDAGARGAILGLTRGSSRAHIARAALEAMAFQASELIELLRSESGLAVAECLADGGAAENDLLLQLQADLGGVRVRRPANLAATARGAAALAGLGAGLWSDPVTPAALRDGVTEFAPGLDAKERRERLRDWRRAVRRVRSGPGRSGPGV